MTWYVIVGLTIEPDRRGTRPRMYVVVKRLKPMAIASNLSINNIFYNDKKHLFKKY